MTQPQHHTSSASVMAPDSLDFSGTFADALHLMEKTSDSLFITGSAGTGKSTLLQHFRETTEKNIVVLAPTGIAALHIGGQTIHSFFRFPIGILNSKSIKRAEKKEFIEAIDTLVIDEISMVRADVIDAIDYYMRLNGRHKEKPFGGVQMIFIGDVFQLPPVVGGDDEASMLMQLYKTPYFFSAAVFERISLRKMFLTKVFRQTDSQFIDVLDHIRHNALEPSHWSLLHSRVIANFVPSREDFYITLTSTNKIAAEVNERELRRLNSESREFSATIEGNFDQKNFPTDPQLMLRKDAQVMFVKNDPSKRWVNGTVGKVKELFSESAKIEIEHEGIRKVVTAEAVEWEIMQYTFDSGAKQIIPKSAGKFKQLPLRLAWAVTIHKSQGKTFDRVIVDMGYGAFAHGQLYVALSRCRSLEGLVLKRQIHPRDVIVDSRILDFLKTL